MVVQVVAVLDYPENERKIFRNACNYLPLYKTLLQKTCIVIDSAAENYRFWNISRTGQTFSLAYQYMKLKM